MTASIRPITADDPLARSADVVANNIAALKSLFPELVTEGPSGTSVNVDVLKQLVGDQTVTDAEEKFGLNWHGKRRARQLALTPSTGTLRPCPEESVDWDTTQNIFIEGDNLEVLKLLQKSYAGRVKLIYIDPPYNTGKDFVYVDDFKDNIRNYLSITGQADAANSPLTTNVEASGRFHTNWLQMLYPRLRVAHQVLRDDGALFISIDDGEVDHLKRMCAEIFGEENFVGIISVQVNPRGRHLDRFIAQTHDNLVVFVKNKEAAGSIVGLAKDGDMVDEYDKRDERGAYRELGLRNRNQAFNPTTRPNLYYPLYVNPKTGRVAIERSTEFTDEVLPVASDGTETCWTWSKDKVQAENATLVAKQMSDGTWRVSRKDYLESEEGEVASTLVKSIWLDKEFNNDYGRKSIKELFGAPLMDFPKSPQLLERIIDIGSRPGDIVMDFFAGSATTGHAAYTLNSRSAAGPRRFILVQLPEPTRREKASGGWEESAASKAGFATIADLAKERLRRASKQVRENTPMFSGDLGFRVFKLDESNINEWSARRDNLAEAIESRVSHLRPARSDSDLLYELLLKRGLDLCVPMEERSIVGKKVHSIGAGSLIACLETRITHDNGESLALGIATWHKEVNPAGETAVVFRDDAFADDVVKTNVAAILEQHSLKNVRSL